jgi:hypothetical protein
MPDVLIMHETDVGIALKSAHFASFPLTDPLVRKLARYQTGLIVNPKLEIGPCAGVVTMVLIVAWRKLKHSFMNKSGWIRSKAGN